MTPLQQKLEQLNLTTMSHHLEQMLAEATAKNLSLAHKTRNTHTSALLFAA